MKVDVSSQIVIKRPRDEVAAYVMNLDNARDWLVNPKPVEWKTQPPLTVRSRIAFVSELFGRLPEIYLRNRRARSRRASGDACRASIPDGDELHVGIDRWRQHAHDDLRLRRAHRRFTSPCPDHKDRAAPIVRPEFFAAEENTRKLGISSVASSSSMGSRL